MLSSIPLYPAFVVRDVFSIEQLVGGRVFAQSVLRRWTWIHEGLSNHGQTSIRDAALMDIKHKLRVFDYVNPETQGQTAREREGLEGKRKLYVIDR